MFGGEVYPDSARDSNGHGTHTATTSAGGPVADANLLGIDRGPIHGIAPARTCRSTRSAAPRAASRPTPPRRSSRRSWTASDVINFSISGGSHPYSDPVELAFLDAYAAGVFVSASAGNSGPGAATADHRGPWVDHGRGVHPDAGRSSRR